jgi:hypothetical protein
MNTFKLCLENWKQECMLHYNLYYGNIGNVLCDLPYKLAEQMLSGYWSKEDGSSDYWENTPLNIIGRRQLADKVTESNIIPNVCNLEQTDCIVSYAYLRYNLSRCSHSAYANDANNIEANYTHLVIILFVLLLCF